MVEVDNQLCFFSPSVLKDSAALLWTGQKSIAPPSESNICFFGRALTINLVDARAIHRMVGSNSWHSSFSLSCTALDKVTKNAKDSHCHIRVTNTPPRTCPRVALCTNKVVWLEQETACFSDRKEKNLMLALEAPLPLAGCMCLHVIQKRQSCPHKHVLPVLVQYIIRSIDMQRQATNDKWTKRCAQSRHTTPTIPTHIRRRSHCLVSKFSSNLQLFHQIKIFLHTQTFNFSVTPFQFQINFQF